MAATGFTPVYLYYSATASNTPAAGNLGYGELAINIADGKLFYKDNANVVQVIATKDAAAGSFTSITDSGNLTFTGTGNRIAGDFSNATHSNRVIFQSSTLNGRTELGVLPNGTSTNAAINLYASNDADNSSTIRLSTTTTDMRIVSGNTGTGTLLPMTFYTNNAERLRIDTSGYLWQKVNSSTTSSFYKWGDGTTAYSQIGGYYDSATTGHLEFYTFSTTLQERMRIFASGGVSINNTTDPGAGNLSITGSLAASTTGKFGTTVGVGAATPAASGVGVTFPSTQSLSTDVNTLDDYREGTFTATGTGFSDSPAPSGTARYVKVGNMVMIYLPDIAGTSNATTFTVTGLPTELYPSANRRTSVVARDNGGAFVMCRAIVGSSGVITLSSNVDGAAWTASGSKILSTFMTFYII